MAAKKTPTFTITVTLDDNFISTVEGINNSLAQIAQALTGQTVSIGETPEPEPAKEESVQPVIPQTTEAAIENLKTMYNMPGTPDPAPTPAQPVMAPQDAASTTQAPLQIPAGYTPPVMQTPIMTPPAQVAPLQMPTAQTAAPVMTAPMTIPTSVPTYTLESLMQACAQLVDKGMPPYDLFQKYGVNMLTELNPENYGLFATDLRAKGAQI